MGNVFKNNNANWGGGIHLYESSARVIKNYFSGNEAMGCYDQGGHGGGLSIVDNDKNNYFVIMGNVFEDNLADLTDYYSFGGGAQVTGNALISDNIFRNNTASVGAGLFIYRSKEITIKNNIFKGNVAKGVKMNGGDLEMIFQKR